MPQIITALDIDPTVPVIGDHNWRDAVAHLQAIANPADPSSGCSPSGFIPRDEHEQPLGSGIGVTTLPQWVLDQYGTKQARKERMAELKAKQMRIQDILQAACARTIGKFLCLNQNPTNYCWCYAYIHDLLIIRELANEPFVRFSPYSLACLIKNFQNNGGWGSQACEKSYTDGVADEKDWPQENPSMSSSARSAANMNAIRNGRQYLAGSRANAALHKTYEHWDLQPRNWNEKAAVLCIPLPVASGYNWMGHERCSIDLCEMSNGDEGCVDLDSYTSDGGLDLKVLSSSRGAADDAVVARVLTPSDV